MDVFSPDAIPLKLVNRLKVRHLALLLHIQEQGSLTRVAEYMSTSQPAVTHALAELEEMFGTRLFDRSARGMTVTEQGAVVLDRARAMLKDLSSLTQDMEAVAAGREGHLNVGVTPFVSGQLLSQAMQLATQDAKSLMVTLHDGTTAQLLPRLQDHTLDLLIGRAVATVDMAGVQHEALYHQPPRLIASRRLTARLARGRLDWPMLRDMDWILGPRHTTIRNQVINLFLQAGLAPPLPIIESLSAKLIGEIISVSDRCVSIVPADIAEELARVAGVAIVPYSLEWTLPPIALFTRSEGRSREAVRRFAQALRASCQMAAERSGHVD
jgi:DNA-binding transcriptional LysR family regulator